MRLSLVCLLAWAVSLPAAEIVEYAEGEALVVAAKVNTDPTTTDHIRAVVFLGTQKLTVKGTWKADDLDVIQNGNGLRFALRTNHEIPVGVVADNGVLYHLVIKPVPVDTPLDPELRVIRGRTTVRGGDIGDPGQTAGGHWEHATNLAIRLHKHIRGGRQIPSVAGTPLYNEDILRNEGRRVAGRRKTENDDWRVYEYYQWTLGSVTAKLIGVTYTGRHANRDFEYLKQKTERSLAIWHVPRPERPEIHNRKDPGLLLTQGTEEFFLLYIRNEN